MGRSMQHLCPRGRPSNTATKKEPRSTAICTKSIQLRWQITAMVQHKNNRSPTAKVQQSQASQGQPWSESAWSPQDPTQIWGSLHWLHRSYDRRMHNKSSKLPLALSSGIPSNGRTLNQQGPPDTLWQHNSFGKAVPLHQQGHSWSHWDQLTRRLQDRRGLLEKPNLEEHHPCP